MDRRIGRGRYRLREQLGAGGMGIVYAAEDLARGERVAIKLARDDTGGPLVAEHMARELRIGRATHHPNVVGVFDGEVATAQPFIVMELATGRPLRELLDARDPRLVRFAAIVDQILAGLEAMHRAGYVHGDIKPENVLVDRDATGVAVKIIDLGLACERLAPRHAGAPVAGTPSFMAPELALGGARSIASEVYAVGVLLYELVTGTLPFTGRDVPEILRRQIEDEVEPPSRHAGGCAPALERIVMRALDKDPRARPTSAGELRAALRLATAGAADPVVARPAAPPIRAAGTAPPEPTPHVVVDHILDAASAHLAARRYLAARDELEAGLARLAPQRAEHETWRLLLALATLHGALGDRREATRLARLALDRAARARSPLGRSRAQALLGRFL